MKKIKKIVGTHHTIEKVVEEYEEIKGTYLYDLLYDLPEFERQVIMLYGELKSYRKVAKCTNRSYFTIGSIIRDFKCRIKTKVKL
jgi:hypothetical protein